MDIDMPKMRKELISDEGLRLSAYKDSQGYLTIGVGHLIDARKKGKLPLQIASALLDLDIEEALADVKQLACYPKLDTDNRRRSLVNMRFQLGAAGLREFGTFLSFLEQGKYKEAGEDLKGTKWFKEVPARASRIIKMLVDG